MMKNKTVVTMKLDTEDYQNIYLQTRERMVSFFWKAGAAIIALIIGAFVLIGFTSFNNAVEKAVNKYASSEEFKKGLAMETSSRIEGLEDKTQTIIKSLNDAENRAATLSELPISISENGLVLMDSSGEKFIIEKGVINLNVINKVSFKNQYSKPPFVFARVIHDKNNEFMGNAQTFSANEIDNKGFSLYRSLAERTKYSMLEYKAEWIAIGN